MSKFLKATEALLHELYYNDDPRWDKVHSFYETRYLNPDSLERSKLDLRRLYVELDAVEIALDNAMVIVEAQDLNRRRAELLGDIKRLERQHR